MKNPVQRARPSSYLLAPQLSFGAVGKVDRRPADLLLHVGDNPVPRVSRKVRVVRSRFDDGDLPPNDQFMWLVGLVAMALKDGRSVHITCDEGRNRSVLVAGAAFHAVEGVGGEELIQRLVQARLSILSNATFRAYLGNLPPTYSKAA